MNCEAVQKDLLGSERPNRPSSSASAHLAKCTACREWLQRLIQLEGAVALLPIPPAEAARSALVRRVLTGDGLRRSKPAPKPTANGQPARRPSIARVVGSWIMDPHSSPRRRAAAGLVAGMAAALLLFVMGWLVWDASRPERQVAVTATERGPSVPTLAAALERYKIRTNETASLSDRVTAMAKAADDLRDLAKENVRAEDELIALADLYARVIKEGIIQPAEGITPDERREILEPIARGLKEAHSQWNGLSQQTNLHPRVQKALENAAVAARTGMDQLEKMYGAS
jgi:hypothetical protein